jgi:predicted transcriptional regulator
VWASAGALAVIVAAAHWMLGGFKGLATAFYSRLIPNRGLDHARRAELYALVREEPGIHFHEVLRRVGAPAGTVRHHLNKLVELGLVVEAVSGRYRCFYLPGVADHRAMLAGGALKAPAARHLLATLAQEPGHSLRTAAAAAGLPRTTAQEHLERFQRFGLVTAQRWGRRLSLQVTPLGSDALQRAARVTGATRPS